MNNEAIGAFEQFLKWGPIGLAGLMLVLVVFALTLGKVTPARERVLKTFMYIGAACFLGSLLSQHFEVDGRHRLVLSVLPNDLAESGFAPPIIKANGRPVNRNEDFYVSEAMSLSIDVSQAVGLFHEATARAEDASREVAQVKTELASMSEQADTAVAKLENANAAIEELQARNDQQIVALRQAEVAIATQNETLEAALRQSDDLVAEIAEFKSMASRNNAVPEVEYKRIERSIQDIKRSLGTGIILR